MTEVAGQPPAGSAVLRSAVSWPRRLARWAAQPGVAVYLLPALLTVAAVQSWYPDGRMIAGGDRAPPLPPAGDYTSLWSDYSSGDGAPAWEIVRWPYFAFLHLGHDLGLGPGLTQRLFLSGLYAGAALAVVFLALALRLGQVGAGAAGVLAVFNAYRLVTVPDPIPVAGVIVGALLGGILVRAGLKGPTGRRVVAFALVSVGSAYVFINPAHVYLLLIWLGLCLLLVAALAGKRGVGGSLRLLAKALPLVVLANLWWVVPVLVTVSGGGFSERYSAAGPAAWAWTQARASLLNGLALNTTWGWTHPEYYPFAAGLDSWPLAPLRFLPALLAAAGVVLARGRQRRLALALLGTAVLGIVVAKGAHAPLGGVNLWLGDHLPGYWLLRDPSKALMLTVFAVALLAGIALDRLRATGRRGGPWPLVAGAACVVGCLVYVYPLFTGEAIPGRRANLPSTHVRIPQDWNVAAAFLNREPGGGRVLVLPMADYYQLPTTWGYYGVSFAHTLIRRPVLEPAPGGYFTAAPGVVPLVAGVQADVLSGHSASASGGLRALGAGYLLLRRDLDTRRRGRHLADPGSLARGLALVPGLKLVLRLRLLDVYRFDGPGEIFAARPAAVVASPADTASVVRALPPHAALVPDRPAKGSEVTVVRLEETRLWQLRARLSRGTVRLRLVDPLRITFGGRVLPPARPITLSFAGESPPLFIGLGGRRFTLPATARGEVALGLVRLGGVSEVTLSHTARRSIIALAPRTPQDACGGVAGGARAVLVRGQRVLELAARARTACVALPIPYRRGAVYRIAFDYVTVKGAPARAALWETGATDYVKLPPLDPAPGRHRLSTLFAPSPNATGLKLYLYADGAAGGTLVRYRRASVQTAYPAVHRDVTTLRGGVLERIRAPATTQRISVESPLTPPQVLPLDRPGLLSDCNKTDRRDAAAVGLGERVVAVGGESALELTAKAHSACVAFPVERFTRAALYRVSFEYRTLQGSAARACLWEEGTNACAALPGLDSSRGWHRFSAVAEPGPSTTGLRLYLYADGVAGGTTAQYRRATVAAVPPVRLVALETTPARPTPVLRFSRSTTSARVQVARADGPFLLVLAEAYDSGWRLTRAGGSSDGVRHVRVDGWANGWLVPWAGSYDLRLTYAPQRYATVAMFASLVALPLAGLWLLAGRFALIRLRRKRPAEL